MPPDATVQIREPCAACEGSGVRRIEAGSGHARWTRRAACEDCEGSGHRARWITLDELRAMLER